MKATENTFEIATKINGKFAVLVNQVEIAEYSVLGPAMGHCSRLKELDNEEVSNIEAPDTSSHSR